MTVLLKGASPLVKKQLVAFGIASIVGAIILAVTFLRVPEQLGVGRYAVTAEFAQGAGLYSGAEVTYLGHPVGEVTGMELSKDGLLAELSLTDDVDVPSTVIAEIRSRSAVGEQYVALVPNAIDANVGPLSRTDRIPLERTSYPVEIGPVLDNVQALVASIDEKSLSTLIDESGTALSGRVGELQTILDSSSSLLAIADANFRPAAQLLRDLEPVLTTVNGEARGIARLTRNLDQLSAELRAGDIDLRALLSAGPGFTAQWLALFDDLSVSLPPLLANANPVLGTLGLYNSHLEQLLSDYPVAVATVQSVVGPGSNHVRLSLANVNKPPECISGFLPPSKWSSPFDTSDRHTPLVYCALPHDDPRGVRGARNVPCPNDPSRREAEAARC